MDLIEQVLTDKLRQYLDTDENARYFDGWEDVDIVIGHTLSEAWLAARPEDEHKFDDELFREFVDTCASRWLEPQMPEDHYKVIVAMDQCDNFDDLMHALINSLSAACVHRQATEGIPFDERHTATDFYLDCATFRSCYADVRYEIISQIDDETTERQLFNLMASVLGRCTADAVVGIVDSFYEHNSHNVRYFMARYVGASRAIRDIDLQFGMHRLFQLWNMTPEAINKVYNMAFYLGNEWSSCDLTINSEPAEYYYGNFCSSVDTYIRGSRPID